MTLKAVVRTAVMVLHGAGFRVWVRALGFRVEGLGIGLAWGRRWALGR
jgi:hypothetical protein